MDCNANTVTINGLSWEGITAIEPGLIPLAATARGLRRNDWRAWERLVKGELRWLVGWNANKSELRTSMAWDAAERFLLDCWEGVNR